MSSDKQLIEIYRAASSIEAHAVRNLLDAEGVDARVVGEGLEFAQGFVPFGDSTSPRVLVVERDREQAESIVGEWRRLQSERVRESPTRPFQFGLGLLLVNTTIVAMIAAGAGALGEGGWNAIGWPAIGFLGVGNLLWLAYYRKRRAA